MAFFKTFAKKIGGALKRPSPVLPHPVIDVKLPKTPVDIAREAVEKVGEKVVETGKDVVKVGIVVVETTGEFVSDTEHFMKTGDFFRSVEKLQDEEGDAEEKMLEARAALNAALAIYVRTALKLRSLSIAHENMQTDPRQKQPGELGQALKMPIAFDVDPDLYGSTATRFLDSIGLEVIGDAGREVQKIVPFRTPMSLISQQSELAEARRLLRRNISAYRQATVSINRATANIIEQAEVITVEVERLETDFLSRGLDLETGASRDLADQVEETAKLELARALLTAGLSIEDVARATELSVADLEGLGADA